MAQKAPDVNSDRAETFEPSTRLLRWIDDHPRTGWWIALWAILVSLNALLGLAQMLQ